MFATANSRYAARFSLPGPRDRPAGVGRVLRGFTLLVCVLFCVASLADDTNNVSPSPLVIKSNFAARVGREFQESRVRFLANNNNATNAWQFGRACFDLAELATNNATKAEVAEQGIAACRRSVALESNSAPAHYYLGMTIGQLADTKRNMAALKMVKEMEREFMAARELDAPFDFAGANRNLGLLYLDAPTIISIGSRSKARSHLQRAVELAPEFPENHLNLIETLLKWSDYEAARRALKALEKIWPEAEKQFPGDAWAVNWLDWEKRLNAAKKKIAANTK